MPANTAAAAPTRSVPLPIAFTDEQAIAFVQPARIPMTLPIHADRPVPIHVPTPRWLETDNLANQLAHPPLQTGQPCGRCQAGPQMRRRYHYRGMDVDVCLVCGWDGFRRAGDGRPASCGAADPETKPCDTLKPCASHRQR